MPSRTIAPWQIAPKRCAWLPGITLVDPERKYLSVSSFAPIVKRDTTAGSTGTTGLGLTAGGDNQAGENHEL
jgi:hypothetical protein